MQSREITGGGRRRADGGFTLLEVIVTVVIMTILATSMVPQYVGMMQRTRLNGATRELVGDIMRIRMTTVRENKRYQIEFLGSQYRIYRDNNNSGTFEVSEILLVRNITGVYQGVSATAPASIVFNPRGTVTGTTVTVSNTKGTKNVVVNIAGRVRVES